MKTSSFFSSPLATALYEEAFPVMAAACSTCLLIPSWKAPAQLILQTASLGVIGAKIGKDRCLSGSNTLKISAIAVAILGASTTSSTLLLAALTIDTLLKGIHCYHHKKGKDLFLCNIGINIVSSSLILAPPAYYHVAVAIYSLIQGICLIKNLKNLTINHKTLNLRERISLSSELILNATALASSSIYFSNIRPQSLFQSGKGKPLEVKKDISSTWDDEIGATSIPIWRQRALLRKSQAESHTPCFP